MRYLGRACSQIDPRKGSVEMAQKVNQDPNWLKTKWKMLQVRKGLCQLGETMPNRRNDRRWLPQNWGLR